MEDWKNLGKLTEGSEKRVFDLVFGDIGIEHSNKDDRHILNHSILF